MVRKLRLISLIVTLILIFSIFGAAGASADSGHREYQYFVGPAFLENPDVAMAPNGATIALVGEGTLTIHPESVTGGGTFTSDVLGSGTWTATQLLSFHSYGSGILQGTPPEFEGGLALIRVHLSPGVDATLQVDCLLGSPPPSAKEGIRLAVEGGPNFNKEVHGETLFIRTD